MTRVARMAAWAFVMAVMLFLGGIAWAAQAAPLPSAYPVETSR